MIRRVLVTLSASLVLLEVQLPALAAEPGPVVIAVSVQQDRNGAPRAAGEALAHDLKARLGDAKPKLLLLSTAHKRDACQPIIDALADVVDKKLIFGVAERATFSDKHPDPAAGPTTAVLALCGEALEVQASALNFPSYSKPDDKDRGKQWLTTLHTRGTELARQFQDAEKKRGLLLLLGDMAGSRDGLGANVPESYWISAGIQEVLPPEVTIVGGGAPVAIVRGVPTEKQLVGLLLTGPFRTGSGLCRVGRDATWTETDRPQYLRPAVRLAAEAAGTQPLVTLMFNGHATWDQRAGADRSERPSLLSTELAELRKHFKPELPVWGFASTVEIGKVMPQETHPSGAVNSCAFTILGSGARPAPDASIRKAPAPPSGKDFVAATAKLVTGDDKGKTGEEMGEALARKLLDGLGGQRPKVVVLALGNLRIPGGLEALVNGMGKHIDRTTINAVTHGTAFTERDNVGLALLALGGEGMQAQIVAARPVAEETLTDAKQKPDRHYLLGVGMGRALKVPADGSTKLLLFYAGGHVTVGHLMPGVQSVIGNQVPVFGGNLYVHMVAGQVIADAKEREGNLGLGILLSGKFRLGATTISPQFSLDDKVNPLTDRPNLFASRGPLHAAVQDCGPRARVVLFAGCGNHATRAFGWRLPTYADHISASAGRELLFWGTSMSGEIGQSSTDVPAKGFGNSCPVVILGDATP